jgi:hypothetical protein
MSRTFPALASITTASSLLARGVTASGSKQTRSSYRNVIEPESVLSRCRAQLTEGSERIKSLCSCRQVQGTPRDAVLPCRDGQLKYFPGRVFRPSGGSLPGLGRGLSTLRADGSPRTEVRGPPMGLSRAGRSRPGHRGQALQRGDIAGLVVRLVALQDVEDLAHHRACNQLACFLPCVPLSDEPLKCLPGFRWRAGAQLSVHNLVDCRLEHGVVRGHAVLVRPPVRRRPSL